MRRRLLLYMGALAALLLFSLFAVLLLLGQLKSPRAETEKALTFQMGAFRSDMASLWRNVSVMGIHLSEDMTALIEERVKDFDALSGSADALEQLEASMLGPLCQYVQQADCSGGFVLLSVSLNPDAAVDSFSGLYVQRSNAEHTTSDLLLYRGMADIGRQHRVMPHRKWAQEFCPADFPGLACVLSDAAEGLDIQKGLLTYPAGGFCFVPDELLAEKSLRGGLSAFVGTELSFVGISEPFTVAAGDEAPHDLTVLIPKSDYDRALLKSRLEAAGVLMLLLFFAVSCCLFYTRRYLRPILRDIERLKDESGGTQMTFDELQPVSARLRSHEQTITVLETEKLDLQGQVEHMQSQVVDTQEQLDDSLAEIRRLAYLGKKELDPADYQKFLEGYAKLSSKELEICAALAKGLSARQCAEQTGNALSTIDTYRKRVYGKTNIHRVRQLRLCYALMQLEQAEQDK